MNRLLLPVLSVLLSISSSIACNAQQMIISIAGSGVEGYHGDGGPAMDCQLHWPESVAIDASGNIYIADANNNVVRKMQGFYGTITTVAGTGFEAGTGLGGYSGDGGPATAADLSYPSGVAVDGSGNLYIADQRNNRIRKVDATGMISTVAGNGAIGFVGDGGPAISAALNHPTRIALDGSGNIFIADSGNNRIRKVDASGNIATIAGNGTQGASGDGGPAVSAQLYDPIDVAVDGSGNVYIADYVNNRIRKVDASGNISTFAGIGIPGFSGDSALATNANLYEPSSIMIDASGQIYFSDLANNRVRKIDASGIITTIAGSTNVGGFGGDGGLATQAKLWSPEGLAKDALGQIYIADKANDRIRMVSNVLTVHSVNSPGTLSVFPNPGNGIFTLQVSSAVDEQVQVNVVNVTGTTVSSLEAETNHPTPITLNVPAGVYFLSVATSHGILYEKIVVR